MKLLFAYIRVSTTRQGEKGSSLQEQRAAIEGYAHRHGLTISQWFEEQETAAKSGRAVFQRLLHGLQQGEAAGVITHKIDRSARNLRDWATLGELLDRGIELHFAHESIDLSSRGGRLSADIQAVVAADFIRNLRDEVKKGFYGRLKQGLYPLGAPLGYSDRGGGKPKEIDPITGPLVAKAFELYASGGWTLRTLATEMGARGLRSRHGGAVSHGALSTILHNPFYIGLMRIEKTNETFQGVHSALIHKAIFDRTQEVLSGRVAFKPQRHTHQYQRMIRCASCGRALIAERQKGHTYYRCHSPECPKTSIREEIVDEAIRASVRPFQLTNEEWAAMPADIETILQEHKEDSAGDLRSIDLAIAAIDDRMRRLTDAFVDRDLEREVYLARKEQLLLERADHLSRRTVVEAGDTNLRQRTQKILELLKSLGMLAFLENRAQTREILKITTSNFIASGKNVGITWENPFRQLAKLASVALGGPKRGRSRTFVYRVYAETIVRYCENQNIKRGS
jgi:site-specific DNA recombinase